MKNLVIGIIMILLVPAAHADDPIELCVAIADLAEVIMDNRQAGADMVKMVEKIRESTISHLSINLIERAYSDPQYSTEKYRIQASQEFKNKIFLECYKAKPKK